MVYLAADNNLSTQGYFDLEEMEAAGYDPEVQVVVQGEFNRWYMLLDGFPPSMVGLEQFTTFRYALGNNPQRFPGIDGPVTYLGATDMSAPATLTSFLRWAQQSYPAQRYILVPWNHGAGFSGLIQDLSQGGSDLMSLAEFRQALQGASKLDIVDFDMCLMGGYETLAQLYGQADVAVFSEELVPGRGLPYTDILDAIQATPTATTSDVARTMVTLYSSEYLGSRSSTTKSAYALAGFDAFDAALTNLAAALGNNLTGLRTLLVQVLDGSQKFAEPMLTDVVDFAAKLRAADSGAQVQTTADALIAAGTDPSFRLISRSNTVPNDHSVSGATGLQFVFPSGQAEDRFTDGGRRSISHYSEVMPNTPWASFLNAWNEVLTAKETIDLGAGNSLELYEVWDTATVRVGGDVDLWLWEPDGRYWIPFKGTRTPNGLFSADSWDSDPHAYYEAWLSNRIVEVGPYLIYAHQWTAPSNHTTVLDVAYRFNSTQEFSYLYRDDPHGYVELDQSSLIEDDSTPTLAEADAGKYANFKLVATWSPGGPGTSPLLAAGEGLSLSPSLLPNPADMVRLLEAIQGASRERSASGSGLPAVQPALSIRRDLTPPPVAR